MSYIISALKEWLLLYVMAPIVLLIQNHAGPAGTSLFLSLTGVVIGGLITLTSIFVKEELDRRRSAHQWFNDRFVFGSIEATLSYIDTWLAIAASQGTDRHFPSAIPTFPAVELGKTRLILGDALYDSVREIVNIADRRRSHNDEEFWGNLERLLIEKRRLVGELQRALLSVRISRTSEICKTQDEKQIRFVLSSLEHAATGVKKENPTI